MNVYSVLCMCVYVSLCVYECMPICVYMCACVHVCMCKSVYCIYVMCVSLCVYECVSVYVYVYVCVCVQVCIVCVCCVCVCVCMSVWVREVSDLLNIIPDVAETSPHLAFLSEWFSPSHHSDSHDGRCLPEACPFLLLFCVDPSEDQCLLEVAAQLVLLGLAVFGYSPGQPPRGLRWSLDLPSVTCLMVWVPAEAGPTGSGAEWGISRLMCPPSAVSLLPPSCPSALFSA